VIGLGRLRQQNLESRNIRIPFDQGRQGPETVEREFVQAPHGIAHGRRVGIDEDLALFEALDCVAREMQLIDAFPRQRDR